MSVEGSLSELLAQGHSPLFDAALKQLLRAYHSDLETTRLEMQAQVPNDKRILADSKIAVDAGESGSAVLETWSGSNAISGDLLQLPASRSVHCKHADTPVGGQSDSGVDEDALSSGSGTSNRFALTETAEGAVSASTTADVRTGSHERHRRHLKSLIRDGDHKRVLERMASSFYFEALSVAILLCFCLLTALDMQREGLSLGHDLGWPHYPEPRTTGWLLAGDVLSILMYVCGALFALEVLFRLIATQREFFHDAWNYFDVAILLSAAIEFVASESLLNVRILRPLRLLRLLRFVRLLMFIRRLEALYFLIQAMDSSMKILTWCCMMLLAVQTMTAFFISQLLFAFYFSDTSHSLQDRLEVFEYFGSFSRSLLTTFEMAMGNWPVPARVLFENVSEWFVILSVLHKMTIGFSVLGIINAVFVQETLQLATFDDISMVIRKRRQARAMKDKLERLFRAADGNDNGRLSRNEFREILEHTDVRLWLASMDFDCKDSDSLFDLLDHDNGGDLSCDEFFSGMTSLRGHARAMDLVYIIDEVHKLRRFLGDEPAGPAKQVIRGSSLM